MPLPPDNVPPGLSEKEYRHLHMLYTLMGRPNEALESINQATRLSARRESDQSDEKKQAALALQLEQQFASQLMNLAMKTPPNKSAADVEEDISNLLTDLIEQFKQLGMTTEKADALTRQLKGALDQAAEPQIPPRDVPEGLSSEDYFKLGVVYKDIGWTEQSRDALELSVETGNGSDWAQRARTYLRTKLPHHPVPLVAEQGNIQAYNLMVSGETTLAYAAFFQLIESYPDFEWPLGNLGSMYIRDGNLDAAKNVLNKALLLNPYYTNAWYHLCRAHILESDYASARQCLDEVSNIDPSDERLPQVSAMLKSIEDWTC